jgi:hypothetical protein
VTNERAQTELPSLKGWTPTTALEQIERCDFECVAGPLSNNAAYRWLKDAIKVGPEFWPGQSVWFEIEAEAAGKKLRQWVQFTIVGCAMSSDTERSLWTYSLSYDPPSAYHYGTTHFTGVNAKSLRLEKPIEAAA